MGVRRPKSAVWANPTGPGQYKTDVWTNDFRGHKFSPPSTYRGPRSADAQKTPSACDYYPEHVDLGPRAPGFSFGRPKTRQEPYVPPGFSKSQLDTPGFAHNHQRQDYGTRGQTFPKARARPRPVDQNPGPGAYDVDTRAVERGVPGGSMYSRRAFGRTL